ncbi:hypothetical protein FAP39_12325 [Shimia litoralis]|uniref:Uncharacterized protein n=1 Tax=Shimia litoralis TaxID=420403 RepID=A0A4U7N1I0_9RHOB|nr:hypothetical protein [Shimia litoralis]TKZ19217.1 hypothetical protein FAP39_12325 [Shimia litoralis]
MRRNLLLTVPILLASCAQFPAVDSTEDPALADAPYPELVPVEQVLIDTPPRLDENSADQLQSRINGLNRRADALRNIPTQ